MLGTGPTEVRVEPTSGGKWLVRKGGITQGRSMNFKKDAIKKGRSAARNANGVLKVFNQDMSMSEKRDYS